MQSGKFQHLITIESPTRAQSDAGDVTEAWAPVPGFTRIFGEVLPDRGAEFFAAKQIQATRNAMIRMYYQPGISERMRVVHHVREDLDEYYDVAGIVSFQARQRELRLFGIWREAEGYRRGADLENPEEPLDGDSP
jgi:SPP1 family predicted phage head-tail adaptor